MGHHLTTWECEQPEYHILISPITTAVMISFALTNKHYMCCNSSVHLLHVSVWAGHLQVDSITRDKQD